jgi:hypothetical protein
MRKQPFIMNEPPNNIAGCRAPSDRRCGQAREHAKQAVIHGQRAQDSCTRAMEREGEGEENDQYGANAKKMYLHQRYAP